MKSLKYLCSVWAFALLALANMSPKVYRNPKGVVAHVDFPAGGDKNLRGNIVFTAPKGKTVTVSIDMTGMPKDGGSFFYKIHHHSVPADGNCANLGAVFNPYLASGSCSSQRDDSYCQVGDLSGKHGWINSTCFEFGYSDPYLLLNPRLRAYVIGRLLAFYFANMTAFACADIELATPLKLLTLQEEGQLGIPELMGLTNTSFATAEGVSVASSGSDTDPPRTFHSAPMMEIFDGEEALRQEKFELGSPVIDFKTGAEHIFGGEVTEHHHSHSIYTTAFETKTVTTTEIQLAAAGGDGRTMHTSEATSAVVATTSKPLAYFANFTKFAISNSTAGNFSGEVVSLSRHRDRGDHENDDDKAESHENGARTYTVLSLVVCVHIVEFLLLLLLG